MKTDTLEAIFRALQDAGARYLIVGGIAVVAYGHQRFTQDLDLVLDFSPDSLISGLKALKRLGYRPRVPVDLLDFADGRRREEWQREKNMKVFNIFSPAHPDVTIDLFPSAPFSFPEEYGRATWYELASGLKVPVVSLARLIAMKLDANRPQDRIDVEKLKKIQQLSDE